MSEVLSIGTHLKSLQATGKQARETRGAKMVKSRSYRRASLQNPPLSQAKKRSAAPLAAW